MTILETHHHHHSREAAALVIEEEKSTSLDSSRDSIPNAAQRNFSHVDFSTFMFMSAAQCAFRTVLLHPQYVIATRMQVCSVTAQMSMVQAFRDLYRRDGLVAFSRGIGATTIGCVLWEIYSNATFEYGRYTLEHEKGLSQPMATAVAAWSSDWGSRFIYSPFYVVSIAQMSMTCPSVRQQSCVRLRHAGTTHIIRQFYNYGGVKAFFSGLPFALIAGSCTGTVFYSAYMHAKIALYGRFGPYLEAREKRQQPNAKSSWMLDSKDNVVLNTTASVSASLIASCLLTPYYSVLYRVQSGVHKTARNAISSIYHTRGMRGFLGGFSACCVSTTLDQYLSTLTYESAMSSGVAEQQRSGKQ